MPDDSVASGSSIDDRHLLLVGAGPGLGMAIARRFAEGGYRVSLVARSTDGLSNLADGLADTGARIDTIAADASAPRVSVPAWPSSTAGRVRPGSSSTTRSWERPISC